MNRKLKITAARGQRLPFWGLYHPLSGAALASAAAARTRLNSDQWGDGATGMAKRTAAERREPSFGPAREGASVSTSPQRKRGAPRRRRKRRRSLFLRSLSLFFTLLVWATIAGAGVVAYYATQLPPIDQLAVPKRPPNIAILSDDGSLIANRGDTGGPAVRLIDLPPYLPKAFVAIEDRRFYDHYGVDPIGMSRALLRDVTRRRRHRGRLDADPAARQESVPDPGAHAVAQDPGGDPGVLARAPILEGPDPRTLSEPRLFRLGRLWGRSGGAEIFRQERAVRDAVGSRGARGADEVADQARAQPQPQGRRNERAAQVITAMAEQGHITEAMAKLALANPAEVKHDKSAGSINYAADYVMDALDDTRRRDRRGHRGDDHDQSRRCRPRPSGR